LKQSSRVVALSQSRLREQVEGMLTRMNSQLVERDPKFQKIAELLPEAVKHMQEAEAKLTAVNIEAALPIENKALQALQKAEEEFELQVSAGRQGGGGGGGGGGAMQQELSELFEQDLDKIASRYETANQASQQQNDREVDDLLEKLKDWRGGRAEAERRVGAPSRGASRPGWRQRGGSARAAGAADQVERRAGSSGCPRRERCGPARLGLPDARAPRRAPPRRTPMPPHRRRLRSSGSAKPSAGSRVARPSVPSDVQNARAQAEDIARRRRRSPTGPTSGPNGSAERSQQARH
jgi:hypothetical protein